MGGLFSRLKTWAFQEVVKSADLNGEFDNVINNLTPTKLDNYSANVPQMQIQTTPGDIGTESLAPSLAGEVERIRYVLARLIGLPFWYQSPPISIKEINTTLTDAVGLPPSRVISGLNNGVSNQPVYLQPSGTGLSVTLKASISVPFSCFIDGVQYQFTSDIVLNGLTPAPATNNTAAVNDATFTGERWTKLMGEQVSAITVSAAGSEISSRVGSLVAFGNPNGGNEIFTARIFSTTSLREARRGYFFNSTGAAIPRDILNNADVLTFKRLSWIFLTTAGALNVAYSEPAYQGTAPATPSSGDYWFDTSLNTWNVFNGTMWNQANAILVGNTVQNTTACIAARSVDFFRVFQEINTLRVRLGSTTELVTTRAQNEANVYGNKLVFNKPLVWDYAVDLDTGLTQADQEWFFYLTEKGTVKISDQYPYDRLQDLKGWYHPHQSWLCIGGAFVGLPSTALTGQIEGFSIFSFGAMKDEDMPGQYVKDMTMFDVAKPRQGYIPVRQDISPYLSKTALFRVWAWQGNAAGDGTDLADTNFFNLPAMAGGFERVVDPGLVVDTSGASRLAGATGGNAGALAGSQQDDCLQGHGHQYYDWQNANAGATGSGVVATNPALNTRFTANTIVRSVVSDTNGSSGGRGALVDTETRPWNYAFSLWIKT